MMLLKSLIDLCRGPREMPYVPPERFWRTWEADIAPRAARSAGISQESLSGVRDFRRRRWETRRPSRAVTSALVPGGCDPLEVAEAVAEWACRPARFARVDTSRLVSELC